MVRAGEVRARELVEAALDAIERLNPTLNAFVTVCGERALAEADAVRGGRSASAVRGTGGDQGSAVCDGRNPDDGGQPRLPGLGCRARLRPCAAAARGRGDHRRQDQHAGAGDAARDREPPLRRDSEPVERRALGRRVVGRERLRGGLGDGGAGGRQRPRRVDPDPRVVLRPGRAQAQHGARLDGARLRRPGRRHACRRRAHTDGHRTRPLRWMRSQATRLATGTGHGRHPNRSWSWQRPRRHGCVCGCA